MRLIAIPMILLVAGCAYTHKPELASQPRDQTKYEADLKQCRNIAFDRAHEAQDSHPEVMDGFGVVGVLLTAPKCDPNDDYFKSPMQMTDECMKARGYSVVNIAKACG